ncbi:efflux RND transporter permease subunit, partial [Planctomycetota bacterium]
TFALLASVMIALTMLPALAQLLFPLRIRPGWPRRILDGLVVLAGIVLGVWASWGAGIALILVGGYRLSEPYLPAKITRWSTFAANAFAVLVVAGVLSKHWLPLGSEKGFTRNLVFVGILAAVTLGFFKLFEKFYGSILGWCLRFKAVFGAVALTVVLAGVIAWRGFNGVFGFMPETVRMSRPFSYLSHAFPGLGREFMPPLDEGSYLLMPTTMPHASIGEAMDVLRKQDMAIRAIPEVDSAVGKIGRAESPLDPAPVSMIETIISYKPEYLVDKGGHRIFFRFDSNADDVFRDESGRPVLDHDGKETPVTGKYSWSAGSLVQDPRGRPFRLWRPHIEKADDIWDEIVTASRVTGTTSAPRLQPISARLVMLQSGMRAPMGIKVKGPDLKTIENVAINIERLLKSGDVPAVKAEAVVADRIVGKAYLELDWDREALDRYGVHIRGAQRVVEIAVGGMKITSTVEGRERYPVRVRYMRELRDTIESLGGILVTAMDGTQIPVKQLLHRQVEIELDEIAAKKQGVDPDAAAKKIVQALRAVGIDEDDIQFGREIPFPILVRKAVEFEEKANGLTDLGLPLSLKYPRGLWYRRGPMVIKSEDTKLVGYVLFDMRAGNAEVDVVEAVQRYLAGKEAAFTDAYQTAQSQADVAGRELTREEIDALPGLNRRGCTYV